MLLQKRSRHLYLYTGSEHNTIVSTYKGLETDVYKSIDDYLRPRREGVNEGQCSVCVVF